MGMTARTIALAACLTISSLLMPAGAIAAFDSTAAPKLIGPADGPDRIKPFSKIKQQVQEHGPAAAVLVASHRGQWRSAPENSLGAIDQAIKDGAEIVEIDVRLTSDGVPVLMHDSTVDRTTDGRGQVADLSLAQIKNLRLQEGLGGQRRQSHRALRTDPRRSVSGRQGSRDGEPGQRMAVPRGNTRRAAAHEYC